MRNGERAGAERWGRGAPPLALLDRGDLERDGQRLRHNGPGARLVLDLRLLAIELVQPCLERLAVLLEVGLDRPVLLGHELADLLLTLADQPQGDGLHPPRREAGLDALPEERRRLVAHQAVEHAARLLRVHLALVDVERMRERLGHRVLGDLVEQDTAHFAPVAELARHVPRDRLALAVRVGGEEDARRGLCGLLDLGEGLRLLFDRDVFGREAVLHVHAELALRQVAHVPHGRLHRVTGTQVLADRLRLRGRLDDNERTFPVGRTGRAASLRRFRGLHVTLLSRHSSTLRQPRERASLPSGAALRKPDDLARDLRRRLAIAVNLRVRLLVERLALLVQLAHPPHRILSY